MPVPPMSMPKAVFFAAVMGITYSLRGGYASGARSRQRQDLGTGLGNRDGVLELGGALTVLCHNGPAVRPHLPLVGAEVQHRFDGERHANFHDRCGSRVIVVRNNEPRVKRLPDA